MSIRVRVATVEDAKELLAIYAPYVEKTAITFEYEVPSVEEFGNRICTVLKKFPYLVAEENGTILGYAYVSPFKGRAAYDWAVETSIYVREDVKHNGIGKRLYAELEAILKKQGILNVNACIACPEVEDEHLSFDSIRFHEKSGYQMVGKFHECGYKFNTWYHMVWMEKMIGNHTANQTPVVWFPDLNG